MRVQLIAAQVEARAEDYRSADAYRAMVLGVAEQAVAGLPPAEEAPRLLAYPEAVGWPLPLLLDASDPAAGEATVRVALRSWLAQRGATLPGWALRTRRVGPSLLHLPRGVELGRLHLETFAEAARVAHATVVAGTVLGPSVGFEATRGWHVRDARSYARSHVFGPGGAWLGWSDKVQLTPGAEARLGLTRGRAEDLRVFATPVGPVGVAVCLDAFYDELVARLDGQGARVLVQPSANFAPWRRAWPGDPALSEGEAWLRYGLPRAVRGRQHLRFGVNPMLVGEVLGVRASGRSSLVADPAHRPGANAEGVPGLLAIAPDDAHGAIVRAVVDLG